MTGPRLPSLIAIAATSRKGESRTRAAEATRMSRKRGMATEDADMRRPRVSSGSGRLLPAPAGAVAGAVPEADGDRGGRQHVIAGDAERARREPASQQCRDEQGQLHGEGHRVDPAVAEQERVGEEGDEVEQG